MLMQLPIKDDILTSNTMFDKLCMTLAMIFVL